MKKKTLFLVTMCLLSTVLSVAQVPNWSWAKSAAGDNLDEAQCISTDEDGNVYVTGWFYSSSVTFGTYTLTNSYYTGKDIFIAKYDINGNVVWAKSAGGNNDDYATSIKVDNSGNIYITGYFNSDSLNIGSITLLPLNGSTIFFAKYDNNGNVLWAENVSEAHYNGSSAITVDSDEYIYLTGEYSNGPVNDLDILIRKYNQNGNEIWTKSPQGLHDDYSNSVSVDTFGSVLIAGSFESLNLKFGSITLVNYGYNDIFLAKYDVNGNVIWAKSPLWGNNEDEANSIIVDDLGNIYVAGSYASDSISFGNITLINASSGLFGREDIFIVKYSADGNALWGKRVGGLNKDEANSITVDASGNIYVTGSFTSDSITFGDITLTNAGEGGYGQDDIFLAKYDANGNVLWATSIGNSFVNEEDVSYSVTTNILGDIYLAGKFESYTLFFGDIELTNSGGSNVFVAKLENANGINDINHSISLDIYPNPSRSNITIKAQQATEIKFINIQGKLIKTVPAQDNITNIDISSLPKGLYILKVNTKNGVAIDKLIIND